MATTTVENLEFHVKNTSENDVLSTLQKIEKSFEHLQKLSKSVNLNSLKHAFDSIGESVSSASEHLSEFSEKVDELSSKGNINLGVTFNAIGKSLVKWVAPLMALSALFKLLKTGAKAVLSAVKGIIALGANLVKALGRGVLNGAKGLVSFIEAPFKRLSASIGKLHQNLGKLGLAAVFNLIRSGVKKVSDAMKEGAENAYWYSRQVGNATKYISEAYDSLSSGSFKMQNQLGAAWSSMIATIEPILMKLISLVTSAANVVTQFFAVLGGDGTYLKAVDYNKQWADSADEAAEAAKEWKNQLMSFDTLNRLNDQTDTFSGSAGKYKDYQNMFEEAKVEGKLAQFFGKIKEMINSGEWAALGKLLGDKFNSLVTGFDWSGWGSRIGKAIQGAADMAYNFLKSDGFRNLGYGIMQLLDNLGSEINFETLGRLSMRIKTALWDVFVGAVDYLSTPGVAKNLAIRLSNFVIGALTELAEWIEGLDPYRIAYALKEFFGNIRYEEIKNAFVRVVSSAWSQAMLLKEQLFPDGLLPTVATHISKWIDRIDWNSVGDTIVTNFNRAWNFISDQFDKIWPPEKRNEFINKVLQKASEIITTAVPAIHNILMYNLDAALFGKNWAAYHWSQGDYAGKEIIMGLIRGTDDKMGDLEKQMEDVSDTVTDTTKRMLNIGSPSKVFETIGQNTMAGFLLGLSEKFKDITSFFSGMVSAFSTVGSGLVSALQSGFNSLWGSFSSGVSSLVSTLVSGIKTTVQTGFSGLSTAIGSAVTTASGKLNELASAARTSISTLLENSKTSLNSIVSGIQGAINGIISKANSILAGLRGRSYATGGFPEDGLFFANHSELVGQFSNGKTAVANNEQIVSGIKQGVYQAVREAIGGQLQQDNSGQPLNVYIGDELVYRGFTKYAKEQQLMSGGRA